VAEPPATLRLFVYGTLKRGGRYHERLCGGALSIEPASVRGRLYTLPEGYPVLVVPPDMILANGSGDAIADVTRQETCVMPAASPEEAEWQDVHGELQTFDDPADRLAAIDALEGFHPGAPSLYLRVLLPVRRYSEYVAAWTYVDPS
jgi:gamma-glutamylcyclotransferase (GGCT)/AIG2-like uncharacterized protein YtfP